MRPACDSRQVPKKDQQYGLTSQRAQFERCSVASQEREIANRFTDGNGHSDARLQSLDFEFLRSTPVTDIR
jgi:hypothetical protein